MLVFHLLLILFVVFVFLLFFIKNECLFVRLLNYRFCLYFDRIAEISFSTLETNLYKNYIFTYILLPYLLETLQNIHNHVSVFTLYWFSKLEPLRKVTSIIH